MASSFLYLAKDKPSFMFSEAPHAIALPTSPTFACTVPFLPVSAEARLPSPAPHLHLALYPHLRCPLLRTLFISPLCRVTPLILRAQVLRHLLKEAFPDHPQYGFLFPVYLSTATLIAVVISLTCVSRLKSVYSGLYTP